MFSGEYAVLHGAWAALAPVPRFLQIGESEESPPRAYPEAADIALRYRVPRLADFERKRGLPNIEIDNREFFAIGENGAQVKLGLGCSAAEAVGVMALRYERAGLPMRAYADEIFEHASMAHHIAQAGMGSGADVAACSYAKPLRYRVTGSSREVEFVASDSLPSRLPLHLVWTGTPSDTRNLVDRFQQEMREGLASNDQKMKACLDRLINAANFLAGAWFSAGKEQLFKLVDEFERAMRVCASMTGIAYTLPVHDEISNWAKRHGGRAKPTGAGGGDMILLIGDLPVHELDRLVIPL